MLMITAVVDDNGALTSMPSAPAHFPKPVMIIPSSHGEIN